MKKLLALALAVMLTLSMGVMAFAANTDNERTDLGLDGSTKSDVFTGIAVPGKDIKYAIQIVEPGPSASAIATLKKAYDDAMTALEADYLKATADQVHKKWSTSGGTLSETERDDYDDCALCQKRSSTYTAWQAAEADANGRVILSAENAWKAYDTDKSFKIGFKATKGADYIKSYEIKKNTSGQMFVQVYFNEYYLGGMKDVAFEITLTVTNADKFKKYCAEPTGGYMKRSEYVVFEIDNYKYGFNGANVLSTRSSTDKMVVSTSAYKDYEIKSTSPTDYDVIANIDSGSGTYGYTEDPNSAIHYKKGAGETYSFDYGNGEAYFEVKMDNQAVVNLYMSTQAIKALVNAYPDAEMLFWNWRGNPEFDFTATVELYYDEDDVGDSPYLYKWDGSVLTEVTSADFDDETCTFKTRSLGAYVISDIELDAAVVAPSTTAASEPVEATEGTDDTATTKTQNPNTGASDFVGVAVALAVVSLAAAGAVALKK